MFLKTFWFGTAHSSLTLPTDQQPLILCIVHSFSQSFIFIHSFGNLAKVPELSTGYRVQGRGPTNQTAEQRTSVRPFEKTDCFDVMKCVVPCSIFSGLLGLHIEFFHLFPLMRSRGSYRAQRVWIWIGMLLHDMVFGSSSNLLTIWQRPRHHVREAFEAYGWLAD